MDPTDKKLSKFCSKSSLHGMNHITSQSSRKSKVFWLTIVGFAFIGLSYELYQVICNFVNTPTATLIEKIQPEVLPFPDIVFCNIDSLNKSYFIQHNISDDIVKYMLYMFYFDPEKFQDDDKMRETDAEYRALLNEKEWFRYCVTE